MKVGRGIGRDILVVAGVGVVVAIGLVVLWFVFLAIAGQSH